MVEYVLDSGVDQFPMIMDDEQKNDIVSVI
jgi:hypothetical protein